MFTTASEFLLLCLTFTLNVTLTWAELNITILEYAKFTTSAYGKPTLSCLCMRFDSFLPISTK